MRGNLHKQGEGREHGGQAAYLQELLSRQEDMHLLFVGSMSCLRHKPFMQMEELMAARKLSVLCPSMSDFATGKYINQVIEAVVELSEELGTKNFTLIHGCQWVILSTDADMIVEELKEAHGIHLQIYDDSHLENGDHA